MYVKPFYISANPSLFLYLITSKCKAMETLIVLLCIVQVIGILALLYAAFTKKQAQEAQQILQRMLQQELKENRLELQTSLKDNREEVRNAFGQLTETIHKRLEEISQTIEKNAKANRDELTTNLKEFQRAFDENVKSFNELQREKFGLLEKQQQKMLESTEGKLELMRQTVDEKLHKTLEERLGQSFQIVSDRLEAVQKGLGEMQSLANGVGDLKKVLSNVKTRGVLGEIQLGNILEQIMAPEQYEANVKTKQNSNDHVEFAIKLPGKDDDGKEVYMPIDAKFPQEDYVRLQTAYDAGDILGIEIASKALSQAVKKFAKDIRDKYIDPPHTTDFGILFLPIEGLFAEVVRQPELVAILQREYKIIVTGPTTLAAMLNSLQMGFRTLAIQKRSSEVWQILGAVKTEFSKFGDTLDKAQRKINEANKELDTLVGTRTRMLLSKLKKVEELPQAESSKLLDKEEDTLQEGDF
jgi:DNA recombination protein RmuC